jgi:hypothetical protein
VLRIREVYPGSEVFPSRIPDPHQRSILTQKIVSNLSEIWSGLFIPDPDSGSGSWFFTHSGSGFATLLRHPNFSYLIVNSTDVKRCIAAGVLSIDVRSVEQEMFQMVHHTVPTRLQIKIKPIKPIKFQGFSLLFVLNCNENPIYVFPEKELRGLRPNLHFHVSVSDLYIYRIGRIAE